MPKGKQKKKRGTRSEADSADKYVLYQMSVQEPEHEIEFFDQVYKEENGRAPKILREDFCGTFAVCCDWVKKNGRTAIGVDLDPEPLEWGKKHNLAKLTPRQQQRVTLLQQDVRQINEPKADILAAQNFSFWLFKTRNELRQYLTVARQNLNRGGIMILDMMGGGECTIEEQEDIRKIRAGGPNDEEGPVRFKYVWEQADFNPITHDCSFYIHFRFKDGSELKRAFEYHWRFWTIPEVRELLVEAGFSRSYVYWEGTDPETGEGDNDWKRVEDATPDPSWLAYIVAVK